mmetsp:Transcript_3200/g.4541  ORF Transcript_3200/g.4541 Transcript_3200/m.4541 type:complete len:767 (-) Transcript_3200:80-2380(-)|eukprot:CAMPEP_0175099254 /NCGR_PEP_ID=MMETSP0086_2-20121207/6339_1 /TAXON_ID=136419 /ORGANISM="Unknown Unknown, Strain D1" /LENGTH=766 /DNA_ID=CAMNT_0016373053 /DNA_START=59 /DNA_END=2359 /DNA_ORIENTATION=+
MALWNPQLKVQEPQKGLPAAPETFASQPAKEPNRSPSNSKARRRAYRLVQKNLTPAFSDPDYLLVGSGPSALSLALKLLAAYPTRTVTIVEQNLNPGGGMHTFRKLGSEFESGTHYLGQGAVDDFQAILGSDCPEFLPLESPLNCPSSAGDRVYDSLRIGDAAVHLSASAADFAGAGEPWNFWNRWECGYVQAFPTERVKIAAFRHLLQNATGWQLRAFFVIRALVPVLPVRLVQKFLQPCLQHSVLDTHFQTSRWTVSDALVRCGISPTSQLGLALAGQGGNYALPPSQASFVMHAAMVKHYAVGGAFVPKGGPSALVRAFLQRLHKTGRARVFVGAEVVNVAPDVGVKLGQPNEQGPDFHRQAGSKPPSSPDETQEVRDPVVVTVQDRKASQEKSSPGTVLWKQYRFRPKRVVFATSLLNFPQFFVAKDSADWESPEADARPSAPSPQSHTSSTSNPDHPISGTFVFLFCCLQRCPLRTPSGSGSGSGPASSDSGTKRWADSGVARNPNATEDDLDHGNPEPELKSRPEPEPERYFGNVWKHPAGWDFDAADKARKKSKDGLEAPLSCLLSQRGKNLTVIATAEWHWVRYDLESWRGSESGVSEWRKAMEQKLLQVAVQHLEEQSLSPSGTNRWRIVRFQLGTPLSVYKYMGARKGNAYGLTHMPDRFQSFAHQTAHLPASGDAQYLNLTQTPIWRTGQDLVTAGVGGALASADVTFWSMRLSEWQNDLLSAPKLQRMLSSVAKQPKTWLIAGAVVLVARILCF